MAVNLTTVDAAITAIQDGGQSFTVEGVTYSQANLDALIRLRDRMSAEQSRSNSTRPLFRGMNFTSMGYSE